MPLALFMDVHVPAAITAGLCRLGVDVLTAQEDGADRLSDDEMLQRAQALGRILFTQDEDLLRVGANWQTAGRPFHGIVYAHQMSAGIGQIVGDLQLLVECAADDELRGRVAYLPLR